MKKSVLILILAFTVLFSCAGNALAWDEVFSDDFSTGNLDKWTGATELFPIADGTVGMNVFNVTLTPKDFEVSKNVMIQFDAIGWIDNFYVQFTDPDDASNNFRCTLHPQNVNSWAQLWDYGDTWINYANYCGIDGGTPSNPKISSIRYILADGVLSLYIKTKNDADFVFKGSHSYEVNDGVISNVAYVPNFYIIGSQDASKAREFQIDNVVIKTLKPFEPRLSKTTIDTRPGAKLGVNFDYPILGAPESQNIYLEKEDGTKITAAIVPVTPKSYNIVVPGNIWLTEGEKLKVVFKNLSNIYGQKLVEQKIEITAATYNTDFTLGELSKVEGDIKTPLTSIEQGTFTLSAKLLPNNQQAQTADVIVMVCKGTKENYSLSDIYYYNAVEANGEKTAELTIGEGEFLKLMSVDDFTSGKLSAESVVLTQN